MEVLLIDYIKEYSTKQVFVKLINVANSGTSLQANRLLGTLSLGHVTVFSLAAAAAPEPSEGSMKAQSGNPALLALSETTASGGDRSSVLLWSNSRGFHSKAEVLLIVALPDDPAINQGQVIHVIFFLCLILSNIYLLTRRKII